MITTQIWLIELRYKILAGFITSFIQLPKLRDYIFYFSKEKNERMPLLSGLGILVSLLIKKDKATRISTGFSKTVLLICKSYAFISSTKTKLVGVRTLNWAESPKVLT